MKSLRVSGRLLTGLLALSAVACGIAVYHEIVLVGFLDELTRNGFADMARAEEIDAANAGATLLQLGLMAAAGLVFLVWFHRAYRNLSLAGLDGMEFKAKWTVWGFVVPILNLYRPYRIMKEIWTGSTFLAGGTGETSWREVPPGPLVGAWWALVIATGVIGQFGFRMGLRTEDPSLLTGATLLTALSDFLEIPTAVVAILLVKRVTDLQEAAAARRLATDWRMGT